ncbi:tripartite motif-containing protein 43-like [Sminthopsis crassicaudata]|uniref:tripartite motif-containing protein 43-like n=1 Tax=Sminthopsis crassicaudata TaxID=9301 RepID=UPI003D6862D6
MFSPPALGLQERHPRIFLDNFAEEEESLCTVCWAFESNIITIECGHGACLSCLQKKCLLPFCCKRCWDFSQLKSVQADIAMNPEGEGICELHQEEQKIYCENERRLLCVTCCESNHWSHIHWPIAVAAVGYRKMLQIEMKMFGHTAEKVQEFQCQQKEKSLAWAVMWTDDTDITKNIFEEKMEATWEYLKKKKTEEEKMETAEIQNLIMGTDNEKLFKFFQKLQQMEIYQELDIVEKQKEWEAKMSRYVKFLRDKIKILEEKTQKTNVELLNIIPRWFSEHLGTVWKYGEEFVLNYVIHYSNVESPEFLLSFQEDELKNKFARNFIQPSLTPFSLDLNINYLKMASEFLKLFHFNTSELLKTCDSLSVFEDKKVTVTILPDSGKTYAVYANGNFQANSIRLTAFLLKTSCREYISFWTTTFEK